MTYEEAIQALRAAGFPASFRSWSLGDTVCVTIEELPSVGNAEGIQIWANMLCIYPSGKIWKILICGSNEEEQIYDSLASAVKAILIKQ